MATDADGGEPTVEATDSVGDDTELGPAPEILGAAAYVLALVGPLLLLIVEENDFVRYHAAQALLYTVLGIVAIYVLGFVGAVLGFIPVVGFLVKLLLVWGVRAALFAGGLFLAYKAYSGERYELPVLGDYVADVEGMF